MGICVLPKPTSAACLLTCLGKARFEYMTRQGPRIMSHPRVWLAPCSPSSPPTTSILKACMRRAERPRKAAGEVCRGPHRGSMRAQHHGRSAGVVRDEQRGLLEA